MWVCGFCSFAAIIRTNTSFGFIVISLLLLNALGNITQHSNVSHIQNCAAFAFSRRVPSRFQWIIMILVENNPRAKYFGEKWDFHLINIRTNVKFGPLVDIRNVFCWEWIHVRGRQWNMDRIPFYPQVHKTTLYSPCIKWKVSVWRSFLHTSEISTKCKHISNLCIFRNFAKNQSKYFMPGMCKWSNMFNSEGVKGIIRYFPITPLLMVNKDD